MTDKLFELFISGNLNLVEALLPDKREFLYILEKLRFKILNFECYKPNIYSSEDKMKYRVEIVFTDAFLITIGIRSLYITLKIAKRSEICILNGHLLYKNIHLRLREFELSSPDNIFTIPFENQLEDLIRNYRKHINFIFLKLYKKYEITK